MNLQSPLISQIEWFAHQATLNIDKGAEQLEKAREKKIKRMKVIMRSNQNMSAILFKLHFDYMFS